MVKVPPVVVDHNHSEAIVDEPVKVMSELLAHTLVAEPASTLGASVKVTVILSVTVAHSPTPVDVKVKIIDQLAVSAAVGVYFAVKEFALSKVPLPEELQDPP